MSDSSLADSLKKVVRRILRTQIARTCFQVMVLEEARRVLDGHVRELARDTLELLVVNRLLGSHQGQQIDLAAQCVGAPCPPTQMAVSHSTLTCQSAAA